MKILCKNNQHWTVNKGQLILQSSDSAKLTEDMMKMRARIEAEVRLDIYDKICAIDLINNRTMIVKNGIENVALQVQDLCAQIAIGDTA